MKILILIINKWKYFNFLFSKISDFKRDKRDKNILLSLCKMHIICIKHNSVMNETGCEWLARAKNVVEEVILGWIQSRLETHCSVNDIARYAQLTVSSKYRSVSCSHMVRSQKTPLQSYFLQKMSMWISSEMTWSDEPDEPKLFPPD